MVIFIFRILNIFWITQYNIIGTSSIITKSFPEGNCVIVGNPAKLIKRMKNNYG